MADETDPATTTALCKEKQQPASSHQTPLVEEQPLPTPNSLAKLPSHSPLAMSNYPPWWTNERKPSAQPRPQLTHSNSAGVPVSTLNAVLATSCSQEDRKSYQRFKEQDSANRHQYLQQPDRAYTHPRLNVFGRDIGPMGKPPPLFRGGGWSMGGKKK